MKILKKIINKPLFCFLLGMVIAFSANALADTLIKSSLVIYDNSTSGLKATNVNSAIDELYKKVELQNTVMSSMSVDINGSNAVQRGTPITLTATVKSNDLANQVTWKSSDESIATVSNKGVVTTVGSGTVTITATAPNGVVGSKTITSTVPVTKVEITNCPASGQSYYKVNGTVLNVVVYPSDATNKSITWSESSGRAHYSSIDQSGTITIRNASAPSSSDSYEFKATAHNGVYATCSGYVYN